MLAELRRNFRLIWDKIIIKLPTKKIFNLWNFKKYLDLGSIIKVEAISAITKI